MVDKSTALFSALRPHVVGARGAVGDVGPVRGGLRAPDQARRACPDCAREFGQDDRFCPFDGAALRYVLGSSADPLVGTVVDRRYEVLGLIGQGGMGHVYRVRHTTIERDFALKALRRDVARDPTVCQRFLREARSAAAIDHPNVCEIVDFGELSGGRPFFVMELLEGQPLSHWLRTGGPLPVAHAVQLLSRLADALTAAHSAGIVHRDLKPENIVLSDPMRTDTVSIVDFGLAQVAGLSRLTRPGVAYGTPYYMSPEQAMGRPADQRSDIYALGVVMYEVLTGRVPFEADTYMGILTKHMYAAPKPPSQLIAKSVRLGALEDLILTCLEKKPARRFQSMTALVAQLHKIARFSSDGPLVLSAGRKRREFIGPSLLADKIEPPTRGEIRRELRRLRAGRWRILIAMLALIVVGIGIAYALGGAKKDTRRVTVNPTTQLAGAGLNAAQTALSPAPLGRVPTALQPKPTTSDGEAGRSNYLPRAR